MALDWHCFGFNFHILFLSTPEPKETITRKKGKQEKDDFLMDITFKSRVKGVWCAVLRLCDVGGGGGGTLLRANRCGMVRFSLTIVKFIAVAATDAADDDAADSALFSSYATKSGARPFYSDWRVSKLDEGNEKKNENKNKANKWMQQVG